MDVLTLPKKVKGIHPLYSDDLSGDQQQGTDYEVDLLLGDENGSQTRDRELKAHIDRIKILETELQRARTEAYQAGFQEGQQISKAEADRQYQSLALEFSSNVQTLHAEYEATFLKLTEPLVALALKVAEQIIGYELEMDEHRETVLLNQVKRVLDQTLSQTQMLIQVNPAQIDFITKGNILAQLNQSHSRELRFIPNAELQPGECKLETEDYLIDSTITALMANLKKELLDQDAADSQ